MYKAKLLLQFLRLLPCLGEFTFSWCSYVCAIGRFMGVGTVRIDSEIIHTFTAYVCVKGMSSIRTGSQLTPSFLMISAKHYL
jgi:hypothetical protein